MKSRHWIAPNGKHAKTSAPARLAGAARADTAARTVTAAALMLYGLGGIAAGGAAAPAHLPGEQASSGRTADGHVQLRALTIRPAHAVANPWRM